MEFKIPDELAAQVAAVAEKTGQTVDVLIAEMLSEAIKMRHVRGILFADGPTGRRARIAGTGLEVFEIIDRYERVGRDRAELQQIFHWLGKDQLAAAVAYYESYPEEIRGFLRTDDEEREAMEAFHRKYPQMSLDWPGRRPVERDSNASAARELA